MCILRAHSQMATRTIAERKTEMQLARVEENRQKRLTRCTRSVAFGTFHTLSLSPFHCVTFALLLLVIFLYLQILTFAVYVSFRSRYSHKHKYISYCNCQTHNLIITWNHELMCHYHNLQQNVCVNVAGVCSCKGYFLCVC